ncbi:MAG: phosphatidylglycerophosphatase A [Acetobacteraceae bacterium]|nr:phosphatidylglycerophosphatase A [Acetobacteraceae bacterium]
MNPVRCARLLASLFGCGFIPLAPGTAASVVAVILGGGLLWLSPWILGFGCVLAGAGGVWAVRRLDAPADPGWVVIDELTGQWVTLLAIPLLGLPALGWRGLLAAFLLFRLFDIAKPGPVGWADRRKDAWGVMGDDIIAGALAALVIVALGWSWPGFLR